MREDIKDLKELRYTICVSGAAAGETVKEDGNLAAELGKAIAKSGNILTTGATVGLPYYAAYSAKNHGGVSIGFSPASSLREHVRKYRLPHDVFDFINYTGMDYVGRDLYMVQSSDAVITIGGRFGSLQEFTSALESHKVCGVLLGSGGTADQIPKLMKILEAPHGHTVIFDNDPASLVKKVIITLDEKFADIRNQLKNDEFWFMKPDGRLTSHNG